MNTISYKIISICSVFFLFSSLLHAVPAYPGKVTIIQPDGLPLTFRLIGDEYGHIMLTDDDYPLSRIDDTYYYARYRTGGKLESTGCVAHDVTHRNEKEKLFLQTLPKDENHPVRKRLSPARKINTALLGYDPQAKTGHRPKQFPVTGKRRTLILLVEFEDVKFHHADSHRIFHDMLNKSGYSEREHIGCARDYFYRQSMGIFDPQFDVYGPVTASRTCAYYGQNDEQGNDKYVWQLVLEACTGLNNDIDFKNYDLDNDGFVDNIYIYYAGYGENFAGASSNWIWPHASILSDIPGLTPEDITFDGVKIDSYGCCAEMYGTSGHDIGAMGTFCHEFGHILGLPDFYDTNYYLNGLANHPDKWDIMASGSYLPDNTRNTGAVPAGYTALERHMLGWGEPVEISLPQQVDLPPLQETNRFLKITTGNPEEYYLLENRQQKPGTYDYHLPYHGLLVYHVDRRSDYSVFVTLPDREGSFSCAQLWDLNYNGLNANADHMCLEIEKAAGNQLGQYGTKSSQDTPFPGRQEIRSFTDETDPSMKTWNGTPVNKPITGITEKDGIISFDFMGGGPRQTVEGVTATDIVYNGFTLHWEPLEGITDYKIYLWKVTETPVTGDKLLDTGFSTLPESWTIEGESRIENGALCLGSDTGTSALISPPCDQSTGGQLTVNARQYNTTGNARLTVRCGDHFSRSYSPTPAYSNMNFTLPVADTTLPFRLETRKGTKVMIDHITFIHDGIREDKKLWDGYPYSTGEAGVFSITNLQPSTIYRCAVEAVGLYGSRSEEIRIVTPQGGVGVFRPLSPDIRIHTASGKIRITGLPENTSLQLYDAYGKMLTARTGLDGETEIPDPGAGIYIIRIIPAEGKPVIRKILSD